MSSLAPYTNAMRIGQGSVLRNSLAIEANDAPGSTHTHRKYVLKTLSSSSLLENFAQTFQASDILSQTQAR